MATITLYNSFKKAQFDGSVAGAPIDFDDDTIKVLLVTSSYTPSATTHDLINDVISSEVSGTGYTARGETIGTDDITESGGTVTYDGDNVTWSQNAAGFDDARYAIICKDSGVDTTSPLVGYIDLGSNVGNVDGDLSIQWNASGIFAAS